jgi:predicted membrane chloride channel (bestrophin family)
MLKPTDLAPQPSMDLMKSYRAMDHKLLFRDRVFSDEDWARHESSWRFLLEPFVMYRVCVSLALPLLTCMAVAVLCALYEGLRPSRYRSLKDLELAFEYSLISLPLSLLLVFKTNTSYARFWEGAWLLLQRFRSLATY